MFQFTQQCDLLGQDRIARERPVTGTWPSRRHLCRSFLFLEESVELDRERLFHFIFVPVSSSSHCNWHTEFIDVRQAMCYTARNEKELQQNE